MCGALWLSGFAKVSSGLAGTVRLPPLESDRSVSAAFLQIRGQGDDAAHHGIAHEVSGLQWRKLPGDADTIKPVIQQQVRQCVVVPWTDLRPTIEDISECSGRSCAFLSRGLGCGTSVWSSILLLTGCESDCGGGAFSAERRVATHHEAGCLFPVQMSGRHSRSHQVLFVSVA